MMDPGRKSRKNGRRSKRKGPRGVANITRMLIRRRARAGVRAMTSGVRASTTNAGIVRVTVKA